MEQEREGKPTAAPLTSDRIKPKVNFGKRHVVHPWSILLLVCMILTHVAICLQFIMMANAVLPLPHELRPDLCLNAKCSFQTSNCSILGQVRIHAPVENNLTTCFDPCAQLGSNYRFVSKVSACLETTTGIDCDSDVHHQELEVKKRTIFVFRDMLDISTGVFGLVFAASCIYGHFLKLQTFATIWFSLLFQGSVWACFCFVALRDADLTGYLVLPAVMISASLASAVMYYRHEINATSALVQEACQCMRAFPAIYGFSICIQLIWTAYASLIFYALYRSHLIVSRECTTNGDNRWSLYVVVAFLWTTSFFQQCRTGFVSGMATIWYFHNNRPDLRRRLTPMVLKFVLTTSFGALCFSSVVVKPVHQLYQAASIKWFPLGWISQGILRLGQGFLYPYAKSGLIFHVMTGENLGVSGSKCMQSLQRTYAKTIITPVSLQLILLGTVKTTIFSLYWFTYIGILSFYRAIDDAPLLGQGAELYGFIVFGLATVFPYLCSTILLLLISSPATPVLQNLHGSIFCVTIFIGAISHLLLHFIVEIFIDMVRAILVCFSISNDHSVSIAHQKKLEKLIKSVILLQNQQQPSKAASSLQQQQFPPVFSTPLSKK